MGIDFRRPRHIRGFRVGEVLVWDFTSKPLVEKTVTGSVVAFSDGADDVPIKSCAVTIAPTLDGVSSVDVVSAGKNLLNGTNFYSYSNWSASLADYGNVPTGNANKGYLLPTIAGVTYTISFGIDSETFPTYLYLCKANGVDTTTKIAFITTGTAVSNRTYTFTADSDIYYLRMGSTANEESFNGQMEKCSYAQLEIGSTATAYESFVTPTTYTANLGRTIYGGTVDVVKGTGTDENGNDFTFTPVPINSRLGDNTMWGDGDLEVTYYANAN